ncbi:hypothetical protein [Paenibacillus sp. GP183]|jgi:hypothetical protein|uniref:hypothetical protein n=1 Tax=Paenibacillus sp. GP183 TaxID=1882751 RepID=UPI000898B2BD|nr:hypothetical protein [Paenibacillus sp. GP183]SEC42171.1 hypothetical protein SAMN05443246_4052 [Paenibacillus sp. GP183]
MKKLYRLGIILLISWAFIVAFGFMSLNYKQEGLLTLIVKSLYIGIIFIPFLLCFFVHLLQSKKALTILLLFSNNIYENSVKEKHYWPRWISPCEYSN